MRASTSSTNGGRCEWWEDSTTDVPVLAPLVTGCGTCRHDIFQQAEPGVTLYLLVAAPDTYQGKTVIPGGVVVDQQQNGQRLWLHLKIGLWIKTIGLTVRPALRDQSGILLGGRPGCLPLPPKWKQWARVTVVGRIGGSEGGQADDGAGE